MSTPNAPLLRQTLAHIEAHPETWNQGKWRCGSGMCFAGLAAVLSGAQFVDDHKRWGDQGVRPPGSNEVLHVSLYAEDILGLHDQYFVNVYGENELGIKLFEPLNTLDDLREIVAELCEQAEGEAGA